MVVRQQDPFNTELFLFYKIYESFRPVSGVNHITGSPLFLIDYIPVALQHPTYKPFYIHSQSPFFYVLSILQPLLISAMYILSHVPRFVQR